MKQLRTVTRHQGHHHAATTAGGLWQRKPELRVVKLLTQGHTALTHAALSPCQKHIWEKRQGTSPCHPRRDGRVRMGEFLSRCRDIGSAEPREGRRHRVENRNSESSLALCGVLLFWLILAPGPPLSSYASAQGNEFVTGLESRPGAKARRSLSARAQQLAEPRPVHLPTAGPCAHPATACPDTGGTLQGP